MNKLIIVAAGALALATAAPAFSQMPGPDATNPTLIAGIMGMALRTVECGWRDQAWQRKVETFLATEARIGLTDGKADSATIDARARVILQQAIKITMHDDNGPPGILECASLKQPDTLKALDGFAYWGAIFAKHASQGAQR